MESLDIQGQDRGEAGGIEVIEIEEEKFDTGAFRVNVWKAILARVFSKENAYLFDNDEHEIINNFLSLPSQLQVVIVRMVERKPKWNRDEVLSKSCYMEQKEFLGSASALSPTFVQYLPFPDSITKLTAKSGSLSLSKEDIYSAYSEALSLSNIQEVMKKLKIKYKRTENNSFLFKVALLRLISSNRQPTLFEQKSGANSRVIAAFQTYYDHTHALLRLDPKISDLLKRVKFMHYLNNNVDELGNEVDLQTISSVNRLKFENYVVGKTLRPYFKTKRDLKLYQIAAQIHSTFTQLDLASPSFSSSSSPPSPLSFLVPSSCLPPQFSSLVFLFSFFSFSVPFSPFSSSCFDSLHSSVSFLSSLAPVCSSPALSSLSPITENCFTKTTKPSASSLPRSSSDPSLHSNSLSRSSSLPLSLSSPSLSSSISSPSTPLSRSFFSSSSPSGNKENRRLSSSIEGGSNVEGEEMIWILSFSLYVLCEILLFEREKTSEVEKDGEEKRKRKRGEEGNAREKKRKIEVEENGKETVKKEVRKETDESSDEFYDLFSAKSMLLHVVTRCVNSLEKKKCYKEAIHIFRLLLLHFPKYSKRPRWFLRISILLSHLKRKALSLEVAEEGVKEKAGSRKEDHRALMKKVSRLSRPPLRWSTPKLPILPTRIVTVNAKILEGKSGRKSVVQGENGERMTVEEFALTHYSSQGWNGFHTEGGIWGALFALLMWDIIFAPISSAFSHSYQTAPLDFFSPYFYKRRKAMIDQRIEWLAGTPPSTHLHSCHLETKIAKNCCISCEMERVWSQKKGLQCIGISWKKFTLRNLQEIAEGIGGKGLASMIGTLSHSYRLKGLPDLLLWRCSCSHRPPSFSCSLSSPVICSSPCSFETLLVEVKGPNDHLSEAQEIWLERFHEYGIGSEVLKIFNSTKKSKK